MQSPYESVNELTLPDRQSILARRVVATGHADPVPVPLALAEDLGHGDIVAANLWALQSLGRAAKLHCTAWTLLELAHSRHTAVQLRPGLLAHSMELFTQSTYEPGRLQASAQNVVDYYPLYTSRIKEGKYRPEDMETLGVQLGERALNLAHDSDDHDALGNFYETFLLALGTQTRSRNTKYLLFPGSFREDISPHRRPEQPGRPKIMGHDCYGIRERKLPVQVKGASRGKTYEPQVLRLGVRSIILKQVVKIHGLEAFEATRTRKDRVIMPAAQGTRAFCIAAQALLGRARGEKIPMDQVELLGGIKETVFSKMDAFYDAAPPFSDEETPTAPLSGEPS